MDAPGPRLRREIRTVEAMIRLWCRDRHGDAELCGDCSELRNYARARLGACPYGERKPTCARCPIHCYRPEMRARIREVMRYAGPRMPWRHPGLALRHALDGLSRRRAARALGRTAPE